MRTPPFDAERMARLGIAQRPPATAPSKWFVIGWLASTLFGTFFPHLRHRISWLPRAGPKGIALYLALHAGGLLGIDWIIRTSARQTIARRQTEARLRRELGRPPWPGEIHDAWLIEQGLNPEDFPLR